MIFRLFFHIATITLCLTLSLLSGKAVASDAKVVAQVGSVPVTVFELTREQQRLLPFNVSFHSGLSKDKLEKMRGEALNALIDRAYKINFALDEKITISDKEVDEELNKVKSKFKTEKEFKKALNEESLKQFRDSLNRAMLAKKAEEFAVDKKILITEADVKAFYDLNKKMYMRPKQFKASHILIKIDPSSNKEERVTLDNKVKDLVKRAKAGEDFYNLAYYNSDDRSKYVGGDLGFFHQGQTVKEFEDALEKMKPGEISDPVRTIYGWHIIKLVEVNESKQLEFNDVKAKIREQLEKSSREKIYTDWMTKLKSTYSQKKI